LVRTYVWGEQTFDEQAFDEHMFGANRRLTNRRLTNKCSERQEGGGHLEGGLRDFSGRCFDGGGTHLIFYCSCNLIRFI